VLSHADIGLLRASARVKRQGQRKCAKLRERVDPGRRELAGLQTRDTCDKTRVVFGAPSLVALAPPAARVTLLHGLGVVGGGDHVRILLGGDLQPTAHEPEVGREIGNAVAS
jgi:hypothetical protein